MFLLIFHFTPQAWNSMIDETESMVGLINSNIERLSNNTLDKIIQLINEKHTARKHYMDERTRIESQLKKVKWDCCCYLIGCQTSNIGCTLTCNKLADHIFIIDLTSGFSGLGKENCKRNEKHLSLGLGVPYIRGFLVTYKKYNFPTHYTEE